MEYKNKIKRMWVQKKHTGVCERPVGGSKQAVAQGGGIPWHSSDGRQAVGSSSIGKQGRKYRYT